jgi:Tfp pilus assembly protein PilN
MSVMLNLLPDVRQAKLRERRRRQLASGIAVLVWIICGTVIVLLTVIVTGQKVAVGVLTGQIASKTKQLQAVDGLPDALTAQQHLAALPGLYGQRVYMSKFFDAYQQADPTTITIGSMTIDSTNALVVTGTAKTFADVAKLDRAMEASNVKVGRDSAAGNSAYFTAVEIKSVGNGSTGVTFTINATLSTDVTSEAGAGPSGNSTSSSPSPSPTSSASPSPSSSPSGTSTSGTSNGSR